MDKVTEVCRLASRQSFVSKTIVEQLWLKPITKSRLKLFGHVMRSVGKLTSKVRETRARWRQRTKYINRNATGTVVIVNAWSKTLEVLDPWRGILIRVWRGSNFLDPTRPDPELAWNSELDLVRPIYARLLVLPSAAESFSFSTKWLFISDANNIVLRATAFCPNNTSLMLE